MRKLSIIGLEKPDVRTVARPAMKVLVCGGFIGESQANAQVRGDIVEGWRECLGATSVQQSTIAAAGSTIMLCSPDIVLCAGSYLPETTYFGEMRSAANAVGAICVFWATEDPYEIDASYRVAKDFDYIFTCDSSAVSAYRAGKAFHLPLAGSPTEHFRRIVPAAARPIDLVFCGVAFNSRKRIVRSIVDLIHALNAVVVGPGWGEFGKGFSDRRIEKRELIDLYAASKIVLNLGRSLSFENKRANLVPSTPGPRTFEAALAGSVQLFYEDTSEMVEYFAKDEILSFSSTHELRDLIPNTLQDESLRLSIATKAQAKALDRHTYKHRAERILDVIKGSAQ